MFQSWIYGIPNNKVLKLADLLISTVKVLLVFSGVFVAGVLVVVFFFPDIMDYLVSVSGVHSVSSFINYPEINLLLSRPDFDFIHLSLWTRCDACVRLLLNLFFVYMLMQNIQAFIRNARNAESYFQDNSCIFRSMFVWCLLLAVVESIPFYIIAAKSFDHQMFAPSHTFFSFPLVYLLWAFICLIFSEVFKEGERLKQELDYTI